jgi:hypothetical protein
MVLCRQLTPTTGGLVNVIRTATIYQTVTLDTGTTLFGLVPTASTYTLSFYVGRLNSTAINGAESSTVIVNVASAGSLLSILPGGGVVCQPGVTGCTVSGTGGSVWDQITYTFSASGSTAIYITVEWNDGNTALSTLIGYPTSVPVLLDGFQLVKKTSSSGLLGLGIGGVL